MALRTTIPTLEIKTSGTDMSLIETLYVTIKAGIFQTIKSNDDIEVNNDIISVSLSQEDSSQIFGDGGVNVSVMAVGYNGDVSNTKIIWVNRGSRTASGLSGGGDGTPGNNMLWYPLVSDGGYLTWSRSETDVPPIPINIKGAPGTPGQDGEDGFSPTIVPNSGNTADIYKLDITTKTGQFTTPNLKGADGSKGDPGDNGFSPTITENPDNTADVYRLDITDKNGRYTTPNLKGADGEGTEALGGLVFGQDSEGNWGYKPPGADTVIPFKKGGESGGGSGVEVKDWTNLVMFHPAVKLLGVSAVEVEADVIVGSAWKKVGA